MKSFKISLFLIVAAWCINGYALDAKRILTDATANSKRMSFAAEMTNPFPEESIQVIILPRTPKWKFFRKYDDGKLFLRLEMYDKNNKMQVVYLKNDDGFFGTDEADVSAKLIFSSYMWFPESIHADILPDELAHSTVTVAETTYKGGRCYEVVTTLNAGDDDKVLQELAKDDDKEFAKKRQTYLEHRTYVRKFIIDKENGLILSRRHYNKNGEEIFVCEFDYVDYEANLPNSLFKTPKNIIGTFQSWRDFASKKLETMWAYPETPKYNFSMLYKVIGGVIAGFAAVLGIIIFAKWRKKKNNYA